MTHKSLLRDWFFSCLIYCLHTIFLRSTFNYKIICDTYLSCYRRCTGNQRRVWHITVFISSRITSILYRLSFVVQKTEKGEKVDAKKAKAAKGAKEADYELPEIPDYERPVLEKPREFDFGEHVPRDKTKLERPVTQVRKQLNLWTKCYIIIILE